MDENYSKYMKCVAFSTPVVGWNRPLYGHWSLFLKQYYSLCCVWLLLTFFVCLSIRFGTSVHLHTCQRQQLTAIVTPAPIGYLGPRNVAIIAISLLLKSRRHCNAADVMQRTVFNSPLISQSNKKGRYRKFNYMYLCRMIMYPTTYA